VIVSSGLFVNTRPPLAPPERGRTSVKIYEEQILTQAKFLSEKIGKENLVFDLSCKSFGEKKETPPLIPPQRGGYNLEYFVMKDGWKTKTSFEVNVKNLEKLSQFCSEFLVHGVAVEGKNAGFDEDLVRILTGFVEKNKFPVVYAGGLNSLEDIRKFKKLSKNLLDFTIGSSLNVYGGRVSLDSFLTE
jgi:phosphoribosylformimino-5-aminoimidazole carboxamide ribotide isomerase